MEQAEQTAPLRSAGGGAVLQFGLRRPSDAVRSHYRSFTTKRRPRSRLNKACPIIRMLSLVASDHFQLHLPQGLGPAFAVLQPRVIAGHQFLCAIIPLSINSSPHKLIIRTALVFGLAAMIQNKTPGAQTQFGRRSFKSWISGKKYLFR